MATLTDRPHTALLVVDVQQGNTSDAYRRDEVIANINSSSTRRATRECRSSGCSTRTPSTCRRGAMPGSTHPEPTRQDSEPLVPKSYADSFEDTDLEDVLAGAGVGRLVVTGAATDECIRSTLHGAFVRGYDVIVTESDLENTADLIVVGSHLQLLDGTTDREVVNEYLPLLHRAPSDPAKLAKLQIPQVLHTEPHAYPENGEHQA